MIKKIHNAHLAILGANIIYALNYGFAKDVMNGGYLTPFSFILIRAIGGINLFLFCFFFFFMKKFLK